MMEVRRHLEELAFQLAAPRITKEAEGILRRHLTRMQDLVLKKDHFGVAEEDFGFHRTVWKASGNDVLEKTLERLCIAVYAFVSLKRHAAGETMKSAVRSHKLLLDALLSGDPERIRARVIEHLAPDAVIPSSIAE
jgi:DNA-binding GntR family transcriptional regulator